MSKPRKRTVRRLKRTLGVSAIILALLIMAIPDFSKADTSYSATLNMGYSSETMLDGISLMNVRSKGTISGSGVENPATYILKLNSCGYDVNDLGIEVYSLDLQLQGLSVDAQGELGELVRNMNGGIASAASSVGLNMYQFYEAWDDLYYGKYLDKNITFGAGSFAFDFGVEFESTAEKPISPQISKVYARMGGTDLSESTSGNEFVFSIPALSVGSDGRFSVDVYVNPDPMDTLDLNIKCPVNAAQNDFWISYNSQGSPSGVSTLPIVTNASEIGTTSSVLAAELPAESYMLNLIGSGHPDPHSDRAELMTAFTMSITDGSMNSVDAFRSNFSKYYLNFCFPVTGMYYTDPISASNRDKIYVMRCVDQNWGSWEEVTYFDQMSYVVCPLEVAVNTNALAFFVVRGSSNLIPVDSRASEYPDYNNVLSAKFTEDHTDKVAAFTRNIYLRLSKGTMGSTEESIKSALDGRNLAAGEVSRTMVFSLGTFADEQGLTAVSPGNFWEGNIYDRKNISMTFGIPAKFDTSINNYTLYLYGIRGGSADQSSAVRLSPSKSGNISYVTMEYNPDNAYDEYMLYYFAKSSDITTADDDTGPYPSGQGYNPGGETAVLTDLSMPAAGNGTAYFRGKVKKTPSQNITFRIDEASEAEMKQAFGSAWIDNLKASNNLYCARLVLLRDGSEIMTSEYNAADFQNMEVDLTLPWTPSSLSMYTEGTSGSPEYINGVRVNGRVATFPVPHFSYFLAADPTSNPGGNATTGGTSSTAGTTGGGGGGGSQNTGNNKDEFKVIDVYNYSYGIGNGATGTLDKLESNGDSWILNLVDEKSSLSFPYRQGDTYYSETAELEDLDEKLWTILTADGGPVKTTKGTAYQSFYAEFIKNGTRVTLGERKITLDLPLPTDFNYKDGDTVKLYVLHTKDITDDNGLVTGGDFRYKEIPISKPTINKDTGIATVKITLEDSKGDFPYLNPYMLVYSKGSSSGNNSGEDEQHNIVVDTPDAARDERVPAGTTNAVDLWSLGEPTADIDPAETNASYRLLISQYTSPTKTTIGEAIKDNAKNEVSKYRYKKSRSKLKVYDIRLKKTVDGEVSYPKTPEELGNAKITITLPLHATLAKNSGNAVVYAMKGAALEKLATIDTVNSGDTVTFTTTHFSQYAILYNAGKASSNNGSTSNTGSSSDNGSTSSNNASTSNSASSNASTASSASSGASNGGTGSTSGSGTGGGNRAGGDASVDMPRTADATTYKAIFILILLAFGAFELISSLPSKMPGRVKVRDDDEGEE